LGESGLKKEGSKAERKMCKQETEQKAESEEKNSTTTTMRCMKERAKRTLHSASIWGSDKESIKHDVRQIPMRGEFTPEEGNV